MSNYREILPQMVSVSNNSQITQSLSHVLADKLSPSEFNDFKRWLQIIEQNIISEKNRVKRFNKF